MARKRLLIQGHVEPVLPQPNPQLFTFSWWQEPGDPVFTDKPLSPSFTSGFKADREAVSADRWLQQLSEPVVKSLTFGAYLQFFYTNTAQPFPNPAPNFGWFMPLSDPVKIAARPIYFEFLAQSESAQFPATPTVGNWFYPWREPVRSLPRAPDLPAAPYFETQQFPELVTEPRWHQPWSEPVRLPLALGVQYQLAYISLTTTVQTIVPFLGWFQPFSEPVRWRPTPPYLPFRPDFANTAGGHTLPENTTIGEWGQPQSRPVWPKPGLIAAAHQYLMRSDIFPIPIEATRFGNLNAIEAPDNATFSGTVSGAPGQPPTGLPVTATVAVVQRRPH